MKKLLTILLTVFLLASIAFAGNVKVLDLQTTQGYVQIDNNVSYSSGDLDLGSEYTIEAWIYVENTTHGNERILRTNKWQVYIVSGTGASGNDAQIRVAETVAESGFMTGSLTIDVPTEEWHHITILSADDYSGETGIIRFYLDGEAISSSVQNTNIGGIINLKIGSDGTNNFQGGIDEVRISNTHMYPYGFNQGFTITRNDPLLSSDANTVLLFHFDDGVTPPTNSSGMDFSSKISVSGLTSGNFVGYNDAAFAQDLPLPITLASFTATAKNGAVELAWETATETNNANFVIYRNDVAIATLAGAGTTSEPHSYSYVDNNVVPGVAYTYVLADVDYANEETRYNAEAVTVTVANDIIEADFVVGTAYPNPFNPTAVIPIELSRNAMVKASLYDLNGREIKALVNANFSAGTHELNINGANMTTGIYLVKIAIENVVNVQRISLVK